MIDFSQPISVLILGAGREGQATLRYLVRHYPHLHLSIADAREVDLESSLNVHEQMEGGIEGSSKERDSERSVKGSSMNAFETLFAERYPASLEPWDVVIVSPGIPPHTPLLQTARRITSATNLFFQDCRGTIIGVTGSKGKSTTSSLLYAILEEASVDGVEGESTSVHLVGNIGRAALGALNDENTEDSIWVFEISSYQARLLERGPDVALILNLFPEHLDYHGGLEDYYRDKLQITFQQSEADLVIVNESSTELMSRIESSPAQVMTWPSEEGAHVEAAGAVYWGDTLLVKDSELKLLGRHNLDNIAGAVTVAKTFGVSDDVIRRALKGFQPLPHRLEKVATVGGVTYYNDSISTTPESTLAALEALSPVGTLIAGGQNRGYDFSKLAKKIVSGEIPNVVLFPDSGEAIRAALEAAGYEGLIYETESLEAAVTWAHEHTPKDTICLLSSASPSYNLFKNFEERGERFREAVDALVGG